MELEEQLESLKDEVGTLKDEKAAVEDLQDQLDTKYVSQPNAK